MTKTDLPFVKVRIHLQNPKNYPLKTNVCLIV